MFLPSNSVLSIIVWIARRFGLELDLSDQWIVDGLDEGEVTEQLWYGRD